ncbi:hypothetical protein JXO59_12575, partial [candidate division KSB1 bacterium]|nr:hypothetical protein [candidate division KSB1 bacterium]
SLGQLYQRQILQVEVEAETVEAYVYIAIPEAVQSYIDKGFGHRDRLEEFVERSVNRYLDAKADRALLLDRKSLALKVTRELLSEEIQGLLMQYFYDDGMPSFLLKHEIEKADLPTLDWLQTDRKAQVYADRYLTLVVKFMIFNQIEVRFRDQFRGYVKTADQYYQHTLSSLMTLKLLTEKHAHLSTAMTQLQVNRYRPDLTYADYAVAAIFIAEELYEKSAAQTIVDWVQRNRRVGLSPLGAEMEFSQLGVRAIHANENEDPEYDGFYYFYDFDLMRRGWKLGAHIDDHGFLAPPYKRTRGFLELAFGRYRLYGDVSKPATQDPWVLAQLIQLTVRFIEVRPHSLHLSIQAETGTPFRQIENPEFFLCLLLLGGDLREDQGGRLREMRIFHQEILHPDMGIYISRLNRHRPKNDARELTSVVEFQFPRLYFDYDYQPLIMALKGFQHQANPYPLKDCKDCPFEEENAEIELALKQWAAYPSPVPESSINRFLDIVAQGLQSEGKVMGKEYSDYVERSLLAIEMQIRRRNQRIIDFHRLRHQKQNTA